MRRPHSQAAAFIGASEERLLEACSAIAMAANPRMRILASAGANGAYIFEQGAWSHSAAVSSEVVSTAGAGDALLAGTIAGLSAGLPLTNPKNVHLYETTQIGSAVGIGLALAAFSITSPHTIHPGINLEALFAFVREHGIELSTELQNIACPLA